MKKSKKYIESLLSKIEPESWDANPEDENVVSMRSTYDKSLEALRKRGYDRHLRPIDVYSLVIYSLETTRNSPITKRAWDVMLSDYGRLWLDTAIEVRDDKTIFHLEPEDIIFNKGEFNKGKYTFKRNPSGKNQLVVTKNMKRSKFPRLNILEVKDLPEDLILALYGSDYEQLPEYLKNISGLCMPSKNGLYPLTYNYFSTFEIFQSRLPGGLFSPSDKDISHFRSHDKNLYKTFERTIRRCFISALDTHAFSRGRKT